MKRQPAQACSNDQKINEESDQEGRCRSGPADQMLLGQFTNGLGDRLRVRHISVELVMKFSFVTTELKEHMTQQRALDVLFFPTEAPCVEGDAFEALAAGGTPSSCRGVVS